MGQEVAMRQDLGDLGDMAAVDRLVEVAGLSVLDIGCGAGETSRALAERGARVLGLEPDPVQAAKNRQLPQDDTLRFAEAPAEVLPVAAVSIDGVFFFRSLHHVPGVAMDRALGEAVRVLKPDNGFLYVVEPAMWGSYFELLRPFHDETAVRTLALAALERTARPAFEQVETYQYYRRPRFPNFESLVARQVGASFNTIRREDIEQPAVRERFEAGRGDGDYVFEQPMLVNLYRRPRR